MKTVPASRARLLFFALLGSVGAFHEFRDTCAFGEPPTVGIQERVPWKTSKVVGAPEPPLPFVTRLAFPSLKFERCIDMALAPGSDRLFVLEQSGRIYSFPADESVEMADLAIDLRKLDGGLRNTYSLAFHPQFAANRYVYVCCIRAANLEDGSQIIRFKVRDTDPPTIDQASQTTILTWPSGGHNGCCLRFGLDGCLYISTGDGVGPNPPDTKQAGQDISNLLSCILRIDVDRVDGDQNYQIPKDNPFVNHKGARGEIWAYGFRNPWRMSVDQRTGDLWVGDVGWELWELLDRVERGGNYGWSVMEGRQPTNTEFPRGPAEILPPTIDHPHSESSSITDGLTYYGDGLPQLKGFHVYGDYDTGKMWAFQWKNGAVVGHREIADTTHRIVAFAEDDRGELLVLDHIGGTLHRLTPNPTEDRSAEFPRTLSSTGLFKSATNGVPAPGVISYSLAAEPWADFATAERWVAVPNLGVITASDKTWTFPQDSVLVKTLSLEMEEGNTASRRRIETQILHYDGAEWHPYTYRWNDEQTDATLVGRNGDEQLFEIKTRASDALGAHENIRRQTWRFAGRGECQRCHNHWSGPPLGFNTALLNRTHVYISEGSGTVDSAATGGSSLEADQLETLSHIELVKNIPSLDKRPKLADPFDPNADLNSRARAYLHVNCAHCHRLHAGGAVLAKMHYDVALSETNMVGARPIQGGFGIHDARVIAPGDPYQSVLLYRMSKLGGGRMPRLGSHELDLRGIQLIHDWLAQLPPDSVGETPPPFSEAVATIRSNEVIALKKLQKDGATRWVDQLLSSTSGALMLQHAMDRKRVPPATATRVVNRAATHKDIRVRDLFERYLPPDRRVQRLGAVVRPSEILSLVGDARRGEEVFATTSFACKNCHRIGESGPEVGPPLSLIGKRYPREQLLESILTPSKRIDPKYVTYLVETDEGRALTGVLVKKSEHEVVIRDARNQLIKLSSDQIERFAPQPKSIMPELLLQEMTAQQAADLIAYLASLK